MPPTLKERKKFVNDMKVMLNMNNYGFTIQDTPSRHTSVTFDNVLQLRALKELFVRLNLYETTGRPDNGEIKFPEADRIIIYNFTDQHINANKLMLRTINGEKKFIRKS